MCSTVLSFCRLRYAGCQCVFSQSQFPMFRQAHWWQKLRLLQAPRWVPTRSYNLWLFGHFGTHFLAYELSITYMGNHGDVTPEIPHGDVDITSPGVIRIDHEPKMNRSSARVSFEEYLKKGMGFVVFISHFL